MTRARDIAAGTIFTGADHTKLDGIATGATAYVHPTGAGNQHVPAAGAAGQLLQYASAGTAAWATVSTGTPDVVFPADWGSPTATYASSTTWSRGSIGADDYVWFYGINGGQGTHGKHSSFNEGYGGSGGGAWFVYGKAGFFDGAAIVIGTGGVAVNTWNQYGAGGATTITTSSSNGSLAYPTNGNFVSVPTSDTYWNATPTSDFNLAQKITLPVTIGGVSYARLTSAGRGQGNPIFGAGRGTDHDNGNWYGQGTSLYGGQGGGSSSAAAGQYPGGGGSCSSTSGGYGGVGAAGNLRMYAV